MKKIDVSEFVDIIEESLDSFKDEMITRNFSKRNAKKWFKMMGDYFAFGSDSLDDDEDDTDDEDLGDEQMFEKAKKRPVSEYY